MLGEAPLVGPFSRGIVIQEVAVLFDGEAVASSIFWRELETGSRCFQKEVY